MNKLKEKLIRRWGGMLESDLPSELRIRFLQHKAKQSVDRDIANYLQEAMRTHYVNVKPIKNKSGEALRKYADRVAMKKLLKPLVTEELKELENEKKTGS